MSVVALASDVCLLIGAAFCLIGGIGLIRMPTFYARTHAAGVTDTFGAGFLLLGLALESGFTQVSLKLALIFLFMIVTGPTASHALAKAAYAQGVRFQPRDDSVPEGGRDDSD